jgi:hypothetical protein
MIAGLMFKTTVVGDVDLQHTKERELVCNNASKGVLGEEKGFCEAAASSEPGPLEACSMIARRGSLHGLLSLICG